jgi:hypothetical protein
MKKAAFILGLLMLLVSGLQAQFFLTPEERDSLNRLNRQVHAQMMQQLGIDELRPGANPNEGSEYYPNYDESLANPCPELPPLLTTADGQTVTDAEGWWQRRRPEIVEDFEREVYGRLPDNIPDVHWTVKVTDREFVRRIPVIAKQLVGQVDNSRYPSIEVSINMMLVVPANVEGPVPVLIRFGRPPIYIGVPSPAQPPEVEMDALNSSFKQMMIEYDPTLKEIFDQYPAYRPISRLPGPNFFEPLPEGDLPSTEQLLAAGWGCATLEPASIQADNCAGLTSGIIGLANQGQPRKPDDWGSLRAWAWGAARLPCTEGQLCPIRGSKREAQSLLPSLPTYLSHELPQAPSTVSIGRPNVSGDHAEWFAVKRSATQDVNSLSRREIK